MSISPFTRRGLENGLNRLQFKSNANQLNGCYKCIKTTTDTIRYLGPECLVKTKSPIN